MYKIYLPHSTRSPNSKVILNKNLANCEVFSVKRFSNFLHPIAIYTYDAGGERIIKQNATSIAIYENA